MADDDSIKPDGAAARGPSPGLMSSAAPAIWLIFLISGAVYFASIVFSATQFQGRLANLTLYGGPLSAWKADQLREEWAAALQILRTSKDSLQDKQKSLAAAYVERDKAAKKQNDATDKESQILIALRQKLARLSPKLSENEEKLLKDQTADQVFIEKLGPIVDKYSSFDDTLKKAHEDAKAAFLALDAANLRIHSAKLQIETLQKQVADAENELTAAKKSATIDISPATNVSASDEQQVQIKNAIYEFQSMYDHFGPVYYFVLAPSDILVLYLIIAMGALGSAMQLSYVYLNEPVGKPFSFYLFRPFLGVVMAFVIFIIAKAGVPLVTDSNRSLGTTVNPYFISFIGIISGLLSERALNWVRQIGSNYFKATDGAEPERWAWQDLTPKFTALNRDPKLVQLALQASDGDFKDWLEGKKPVPLAAQNLIAATLGEPRRALFTDLPPP